MVAMNERKRSVNALNQELVQGSVTVVEGAQQQVAAPYQVTQTFAGFKGSRIK